MAHKELPKPKFQYKKDNEDLESIFDLAFERRYDFMLIGMKRKEYELIHVDEVCCICYLIQLGGVVKQLTKKGYAVYGINELKDGNKKINFSNN